MSHGALTMLPARQSAAHLSTEQLDDLREIITKQLLVERSRVDQTLAAVNDFATAYSPEDRELSRVVLERGSEQVTALERALTRIDDGTYGFCVGCGRPISFEWLSTIPENRHCVGCMRIG